VRVCRMISFMHVMPGICQRIVGEFQ
jgi:hypothetical protein